MSIHLRSYRPEDLDPLIQLWYRTWHHTFPDLRHPLSIEQWKTRFQQNVVPNESIWVAESGSQLVGFMAIRKSDNYLDLIFVSTEAQGQGVGTILLNKAKEISPEGVYLDTLQRNMQARRFYERHGFQPGDMGKNSLTGLPDIEYHWTPER